MNLPSIIDAVGPVAVREIKQTGRHRVLYLLRVGYVIGLLFVMFSVWERASTVSFGNPNSVRSTAQLGSSLYESIISFQFAGIVVLAPFLICPTIIAERNGNTIDLLRVAGLTDRQILAGKLIGRSFIMVFPIIAGIPTICLAVLLGGIDPLQLFNAELLTLSTVCGASAICVFCSAGAVNKFATMVRSWILIMIFVVLQFITMHIVPAGFAPIADPLLAVLAILLSLGVGPELLRRELKTTTRTGDSAMRVVQDLAPIEENDDLEVAAKKLIGARHFPLDPMRLFPARTESENSFLAVFSVMFGSIYYLTWTAFYTGAGKGLSIVGTMVAVIAGFLAAQNTILSRSSGYRDDLLTTPCEPAELLRASFRTVWPQINFLATMVWVPLVLRFLLSPVEVTVHFVSFVAIGGFFIVHGLLFSCIAKSIQSATAMGVLFPILIFGCASMVGVIAQLAPLPIIATGVWVLQRIAFRKNSRGGDARLLFVGLVLNYCLFLLLLYCIPAQYFGGTRLAIDGALISYWLGGAPISSDLPFYQIRNEWVFTPLIWIALVANTLHVLKWMITNFDRLVERTR